ncbi:MAG: acetyl-CoA synthetase [Ruminococcaceae bacterium]|nr:acetyl-CoA synthetase [Oscillospiraceae bacterium]
METKNYLLNKFLDRIDFDSYEDFKKNYKLNIPDNFNFAYDVVDEWARVAPDKLALVHITDDEKETRYNFSDIKRLSDKAANMLTALGIGRGDTVMLILKQRAEVWVMLSALCKIGAVAIPATFQLTPKDIVYRCECADIKMICCVDDDNILDNIKASRNDCKTLKYVGVVGDKIPEGCIDLRKCIDESSENFEKKETPIHDPMLIYFSSGTTGMPKMILHDFTYPLGHITTANYWHRVDDGALHLTVCDSGWAKFAWGKIYGQWICGAAIVAYDTEKFNPESLLKVVRKLKVNTFCAPPTIYRFLIKAELKREDFASVKHCTIAGEPLLPDVFNKFKDITGLEVTEGFGQTETTVLLANYKWYPIKPGSMGKPSPLYDIELQDENGNPCEDGEVGAIVVKNVFKNHPTGLFIEYYRSPEAMEHSFKNGNYNTGDMAWRDSDGYYWFEGRNDDIIKCSGYRIGPFEVENALASHPSVLECAVTAAPDPIRGQVVKATIVLVNGYTPSDELKKELQDHVKKTTAPYKYPRIIDFVSSLPKTASSKIMRKSIRNENYDSAKKSE